MVSEMFESQQHTEVQSEDGSFTAYSKEYGEHYHSTKDGALKESYEKHVIPAYYALQSHKEVTILDICYGLGFNTLCTLLYYQEHSPETKLRIYSPELDIELVKSLENFPYPQEFETLKDIITTLSREGFYKSENIYIEIFLGDAREYVRKFTKKFDIVYQDAFSPSINAILWTQEYFADIQNAIKENGVLTTYSIALKIRMALYENGFKLYLNEGENYRTATMASLRELEGVKSVDMEHKIACNPDVHSLRDGEL